MFVSEVPFLLDNRSQVWHFFIHSNGRSFKKWDQQNRCLMSDKTELKCVVICWCKNIWKNKARCWSTFTRGDILLYSKCGTELTKQMHCITIDDMETPSDAYGNILLRHRRLIILVSEWPGSTAMYHQNIWIRLIRSSVAIAKYFIRSLVPPA